MAKQFVLAQADIDRLLTMICRDPEHGHEGGSSQASVNDGRNRMIYSEAHRFYNYQIRKWIDEISR